MTPPDDSRVCAAERRALELLARIVLETRDSAEALLGIAPPEQHAPMLAVLQKLDEVVPVARQVLAAARVLPMTMSAAGSLGGRAVFAKRGQEHYKTVGKKGGTATFAKFGRDHYREIARKGGLARAAQSKAVEGAGQ